MQTLTLATAHLKISSYIPFLLCIKFKVPMSDKKNILITNYSENYFGLAYLKYINLYLDTFTLIYDVTYDVVFTDKFYTSRHYLHYFCLNKGAVDLFYTSFTVAKVSVNRRNI